MSPKRRQAKGCVANLISTSQVLKIREDWKYAALKASLTGRAHDFEFPIGRFVFDLALLDRKILVEFDGPDHNKPSQRAADIRKNKIAEEAGFVVVRRSVRQMAVIDPSVIDGL